MVRLIWTELAVEDLRLIHEYIYKDSKLYADRFVEKITSRIDQLENSQLLLRFLSYVFIILQDSLNKCHAPNKSIFAQAGLDKVTSTACKHQQRLIL